MDCNAHLSLRITNNCGISPKFLTTYIILRSGATDENIIFPSKYMRKSTVVKSWGRHQSSILATSSAVVIPSKGRAEAENCAKEAKIMWKLTTRNFQCQFLVVRMTSKNRVIRKNWYDVWRRPRNISKKSRPQSSLDCP